MTALAAARNTARMEGHVISRPAGVDVIYKGSLVGIPSDGYAEALVLNTAKRFGGVALETVDNSAGSNGDLEVPCHVSGVFKFAATSITQAMVGQKMYAVDDQTFDDQPDEEAIFVGILVRYESATEGWIDITPACMGMSEAEIGVIEEVVDHADFTDGGGAAGTINLTAQMPAGAIPLGCKFVVSEGFAGDTTAVVQAGVSGDADRFTLNTDQSVLAVATVGSVPATDCCDGMNAAQTIVVTVTGASDWGNITAGTMRVIVYYLLTP